MCQKEYRVVFVVNVVERIVDDDSGLIISKVLGTYNRFKWTPNFPKIEIVYRIDTMDLTPIRIVDQVLSETIFVYCNDIVTNPDRYKSTVANFLLWTKEGDVE